MAWNLENLYPTKKDYEKDIRLVESLLEQLEAGHLSTQQSVPLFERASALCDKLQAYISLRLSLDRSSGYYSAEEMNLSRFDPRLKVIEDTFLFSLSTPNSLGVEYEFYRERLLRQKQHYGTQEIEAFYAKTKCFSSSNWTALRKEYIQNARSKAGHSMSQAQAMSLDRLRAVRVKGFEEEVEICESVQEICCRALNAIKHENAAVATMRGYSSILDMRLDQEGLAAHFLDSVFEAVEQISGEMRSYVQRKTILTGESSFQWNLLQFEPISSNVPPLAFERSIEIINKAFCEFHPAAGSFTEEALAKKWIDHEVRSKKRSGAFCHGVFAAQASYVMLTYSGKLRNFVSLAHEMGHGVHHRLMHDAGFLGVKASTTLKEGVAHFFELIALDELMRQDKTYDKHISSMQATSLSSTFLDVSSRFWFEKEVAENCSTHYFSSDELNNIMLASQKKALGDLPQATYHPLNWVSKPHFYYAGRAYYNYPYIVGRLLAYRMFAIWKNGGADLIVGMLRESGKCQLKDSLKRIGFDGILSNWEEPLDLIRSVITNAVN